MVTTKGRRDTMCKTLSGKAWRNGIVAGVNAALEQGGELPIFKLNGRVAAYADALDAAMREKEPVTLEARARRREFLGLPRRAAEVTSGADLFAPRQILHLISRAESMLSESGAFLTDRHRDSLWERSGLISAEAPIP